MPYDYDDEDDFGTKQMAKGKGESRAGRLAAAKAIGSGDAPGGLAAYGAMSGNPYALGAGLGLSVLSEARKRKRHEAEMEAKMKLERLQRQDNALARLIGVSQGLRRL